MSEVKERVDFNTDSVFLANKNLWSVKVSFHALSRLYILLAPMPFYSGYAQISALRALYRLFFFFFSWEQFYWSLLLRDLVAPKGAVCLCWQTVRSNRQIRTEFGLVVSERTLHPWLSQSFSWRARCMSQHHGSRSQGKL